MSTLPCNARQPLRHERGAALLMAMMIVALIATFATGALWVQWRGISVEESIRKQAQARWLIEGAMDWVRLVLREDMRSDENQGRRTDHTGEPWAVPLKEIKLSSFLSTHVQSNADIDLPVFLSGEIQDAQAKFNLANGWNKRDPLFEPALKRLFNILQLPTQDYTLLVRALNPPADGQSPVSHITAQTEELRLPYIPRQISDLAILGISTSTLDKLAAHATWLPENTAVNFLTASPEVLYACGMDLAAARSWVQERNRLQFETPEKLSEKIGLDKKTYADLNTRFFWVKARLRMDDWVAERLSLVRRQGLYTAIVYSEGL